LMVFLIPISVETLLSLVVFLMAVLLTDIVISFLFWRCPNCQKGFPIKYSIVDKGNVCPYCGSSIK
ncbi:MAG: hypothetical protein K2P39_00955, partial [Lachnospiraceae bacterium]|nr:hypothetical protein [Lachnospiraceae bacterium]